MIETVPPPQAPFPEIFRIMVKQPQGVWVWPALDHFLLDARTMAESLVELDEQNAMMEVLWPGDSRQLFLAGTLHLRALKARNGAAVVGFSEGVQLLSKELQDFRIECRQLIWCAEIFAEFKPSFPGFCHTRDQESWMYNNR